VSPPSTGAVKSTVAVVGPVAVAVPIVGAPGSPSGVVIELLAELAAEVPILFVAVTVNVYDVLLLKPVILIVPEPA